ncbi:MAG: hypothetical protein ABSE05_07095 [Syntrophales bacterium]|jgi:hypothetical protein
MTHRDRGNYKAKHSSASRLDQKISRALEKKAADGKITCTDASDIVSGLDVTMKEVGVTIDLMEIRISKCQLGLFGYSPEKMVVKPAKAVQTNLERAIRSALVNDCLPCAAAWSVAETFGIPKMAVSSACETLKIKVKPCQLGAF